MTHESPLKNKAGSKTSYYLKRCVLACQVSCASFIHAGTSMMNMAVAPVSVMACEGAAIVIALIESILGLTYSWLVVAIVCGRGL